MHGAVGDDHDIATETLAVLTQKRRQVRRTDLFLAVVEKFDLAGWSTGHRPHGP